MSKSLYPCMTMALNSWTSITPSWFTSILSNSLAASLAVYRRLLCSDRNRTNSRLSKALEQVGADGSKTSSAPGPRSQIAPSTRFQPLRAGPRSQIAPSTTGFQPLRAGPRSQIAPSTYGNHNISTSESRGTSRCSGTPNLACKAKIRRSAARGREWTNRTAPDRTATTDCFFWGF